jgi:formyltetrahydrofolate hydrolase
MNQIIDEAYENYQWKQPKSFPAEPDSNLSKEEFINKCKTDPEFSDKWGLKIEERELSREERYNLMPSITGHSKKNLEMRKRINNFEGNIPGVSYHEEWLDSFGIPTKLITITYNDIKTEIYE